MRSLQVPMMVTLKNILYLTDFSEPSEAALPFAVAIARKYGGTVHALHVLTPVIPQACPTAVTADEEVAEAELSKVGSYLAGVAHQTSMVRGIEVWPEIERVIKQHHIDLVVLGTHGRTGAQKLMLGSVAEEIFRRSSMPVLTIGPEVHSTSHNGARFHRVLFATDFTPESVAAAPYAVSLAQENEARLLLLHVMRKPRRGNDADERLFELSAAEAISQLYESCLAGTELNIPPEAVLEYGEAADRIVVAAKDRGADLIVLGVRNESGHLGAATHLERTTAHKVVAHAPCPVVTVRG